MGQTLEITDSNFSEVIAGNELVLVDFWAEWCGPCKMIAPTLEELAGEYAGKAIIGKLNVDDNAKTSAQFGVRSIPTLLIFKNGVIVDKQVGAVGKPALKTKLDAQLA